MSKPRADGARPGTVYLVGAGPGDPALLTVRAAALLATADVILHDELVSAAVLERCHPGAEIRSVGKRGGDPVVKQASQEAIESELCALASAGKSVVRLKGGDPFLFGRGSEEAEALVRCKLPFEVVPGIPSPFGATAYAGISVTHRDLASSVTIVSGTTRAGVEYDWRELATVRGTICVLMGMRKLDEVSARLVREAGRSPETPAAVVQWGTLPSQRVVEGTLEDIAERAREAGIGSPAIVVVGPVVRLRRTIQWFDSRPLFGKRILVPRARHQAQATSDLLRTFGAEPYAFAAISLEDPPDSARVGRAVAGLGSFDLVAFTSENGVDRFFAAIAAAGKDARAFGGAVIAAIGPGTAAALALHGVRADVVPASSFRGEALADAILAHCGDRPPKRALIPRALVAREVLPEMFRARGVEVDVVPVYETVPASADRRAELVAELEAGRVDAAILTSTSTVENLAALLGPEAPRLLAKVALASIGPITTRSAEALGLRIATTAEESTVPGTIAALERFFARSRAAPGV